MKQIFHKIVSFRMAFVVLFSTMSFSVNMHYCGDTLVETAIFHKAKGCGMEMQKPSTDRCNVNKKNCCNNKQLVVDGQNELQQSFDSLSLEQQKIVVSFVCSYLNLIEIVKEDVNSYTDYTPPLVIRQLFKLDETYLI